MQLTVQDIIFARSRIATGVVATPCPESIPLSDLCGAQVFCKLEYLQRTGSFKERGARNALLLLSEEQRQKGVISASAGNHAQAMAYHGGLLGVPVTVVMPEFAPLIKRTNCRKLGAKVILAGDTFAAAKEHAQRIATSEGLMYIHGFDDLAIIAGQGTLGLEVLEQVPECDAVVIPIGGAGLIAGVGLAIKSLRPEVQVIGVEAASAASFSASLAAGEPVAIDTQPTLADGLAISQVGAHAFEIARANVDKVVQVSEQQIALAILRLMELEKAVVEGAGAAALAALLTDQLPELQGKRVVLVLCGGNIDLTSLHRLIEIGMLVDGRLTRFTAQISDRPGGLARLASLIAQAGASIVDVTHDRAFSGLNFAAVNVLCTVETRDADHIQRMFGLLTDHGIAYVVHKPSEI